VPSAGMIMSPYAMALIVSEKNNLLFHGLSLATKPLLFVSGYKTSSVRF